MEKPIAPIVETRAGKVEGTEREGLFIFRGIPYAAAPVGERRWLPPAPVKPWAGVRAAKEYAPVAPQLEQPGGLWQVVGGQTQSEDCLYLNIWTPGLDNAKRPVMLWIHGGGFLEGAGSQAGYRGHVLAKRGNAVIITINYRLGALGFLRLNDVTGGRIPSTGNEGLLDQAAAMKWVRENIGVFGGDPNNISIFGESAGGMSIGAQLAMPGSKGLFDKAILQSGAANTVEPAHRVARVAGLFLEDLGIKGTDIKGLQSLTTKQLLDAQKAFLVRVRTGNLGVNSMPFQPGIDGKTLPMHPLQAIKEGASSDIPVIVGSTLNEWGFFTLGDQAMATLSDEHLRARLKSSIPVEHLPTVIDVYRKALKERGLPATNGDVFSAIQTDRVFRLPAIWLAEAKQSHKKPAYHYIFTWPSPAMGGKLGACHAIEIGFLWGTYEATFSGTGPAADELSRKMQDGWLAMAHKGNPTCESLGEWPKYGIKRETMMLGAKCHLEMAPFEAERKVWESIPGVATGAF